MKAENPARRAQALIAFFRGRIETEWDPDQGRGHLVFRRGAGGVPEAMCDLLCGEGVVLLTVEAPAEDLQHLEEWVEEGLAPADGGRDTAPVEWTRQATPREG